jgi:hypothetical protein
LVAYGASALFVRRRSRDPLWRRRKQVRGRKEIKGPCRRRQGRTHRLLRAGRRPAHIGRLVFERRHDGEV